MLVDAAQTAQTAQFDAHCKSVYLWQYVAPQLARGVGDETRRKLLVSLLRLLCAQHLALNADALCHDYLKMAAWTCWEPVWRAILGLGRDLPDVFRMFAAEFGGNSSFWCHETSLGSLESPGTNVRSQALEASLIPVHRKHRLENVFSNVAIDDFVAFVTKLPCSVVVDCSSINSFSTQQIISLLAIPGLTALDLSGLDVVDDQFLYTFRLCLIGKSLKLRILRLSGCANVTKQGLAWLFESKEILPLHYVESDVLMLGESLFARKFLDTPLHHTVVPNSKWKLLDEKDPITLLVAHYSLAYKLHYFLHNTKLIAAPKLVWDFKFFPDSVDAPDLVRDPTLLETTWAKRLRLARTNSAYTPFCYVHDPGQKIIPHLKIEPMKEIDTPFIRQGTEKTKKTTLRKPIVKKTDVNNFFGL